MSNFDSGPLVFVGLMACVGAVAVLAPKPEPAAEPARSGYEQAWLAYLQQEMGPVLGHCVWSDVSAFMEPGHLRPVLERAKGDHHLYPRLDGMVERAKTRCSRSLRIAETED